MYRKTSEPSRHEFARLSGKYFQSSGARCQFRHPQETNENIAYRSCYDVEIDISKNFKSLFIICHSINDKWKFRKNIGRLLELEREVELCLGPTSSFRLWENLREIYTIDFKSESLWKLYCRRGTVLPSKKTQELPAPQKSKCSIGIEENGINVDEEQALFAAALEQIKNLNKEVVALRKRVNNSLERMEQMEQKSGHN